MIAAGKAENLRCGQIGVQIDMLCTISILALNEIIPKKEQLVLGLRSA